jgi:hypothetical protein
MKAAKKLILTVAIALLQSVCLLSPQASDAHATLMLAKAGGASLSFTASPTRGTAPLAVQFEAALQENKSYTVEFGDGESSRDLNRTPCRAELCPTSETPLVIARHTYTSAGTYRAVLRDSNGPRATLTIVVAGGR